MQLRATLRYDADIAAVGAMLADDDFVTAKVRATGALAHDVAVVGEPGRAFTVTTRRQLPTTGIPPHLRPLVGSTLEIRQVEAWEAQDGQERRGTIVVEIVGTPVRLTGTLHLVGDPAGTTTGHVHADVRAPVPLFGQALEEATSQAVQAAVVAEEQAAAEWLAG